MSHKPKSVSSAVYLHQNQDASWEAVVSVRPPSTDFVKLCDEKDYPAELFYERLDMNGSSVVEMFRCEDRKELLESLNWVGQCHSIVRSLWDFDLTDLEPDILNIFRASLSKKYEIIKAEWDAITEEDEWKTPLFDQIQSAADRASASQHEAGERIPQMDKV